MASLLAQVQDQRYVGKVMAVVTTKGTPSFSEWFRQELLKQA
ncbi:hypothetical protein [Deinococcus sp.]